MFRKSQVTLLHAENPSVRQMLTWAPQQLKRISDIRMNMFRKWLHFPVGFPGGSVGKESACNAGDTGDASLILESGRFPWRKKWQPAPVFLPGESHGQRGLMGYTPWGHKELDMAEHAHTHTQFFWNDELEHNIWAWYCVFFLISFFENQPKRESQAPRFGPQRLFNAVWFHMTNAFLILKFHEILLPSHFSIPFCWVCLMIRE